MPSLTEDSWINQQAVNYPIAEIEDCAIAVDATYYFQLLLHSDDGSGQSFEPLLPALGGMTGIVKRIEDDLDQWANHRVTPLFVFDGQVVEGQDEISRMRGRKALEQTQKAWDLYFGNQAIEAVTTFGSNIGAIRPETLYSVLQKILRKRQLHFLVAPYNAAAQIAYLDMIDSNQCAGIMGSQELFLYPIKDCVLRSMNWEKKSVSAISKNYLLRALNVSEPLFVDALLTTGTSFLTRFPALLEPSVVKSESPNVKDAVNLLRATDKSVAVACSSFNDFVQAQDPLWLDKFRKARMVISHFIYIAENGEIKVHDFEHLTSDNHEYLGLQLPAELFHYLNTGLIGPRILSWVTHLQIVVLPTVDGFPSPEYKRLVESQTLAIKEHALAIITSALHRGIQHKDVTLKLWYKPDNPDMINHRTIQPTTISKVTKWTVKEAATKEHFPQFSAGSIASELLALKKADFVQSTHTKEKAKGINSADSIVTLTLWRFLHLRDYISDAHTLTKWGNALATAMEALKPTVDKNPDVGNLYEQLLVAFELIRFDLLNSKNKHEELQGLPMNGTEEDKASLLLVSRCASLLKLRHESIGYTGPLSKNLLHFRSLASEVRSADRDLTEAILASTFLRGQSERERDDYFEISQRLPFIDDPDVALGIAVKTYFDDILPTYTQREKEDKKREFPKTYLPYAVNFAGDLEIACSFFDAIHAGVKTLDDQEMTPKQRKEWDDAAKYLKNRR